MSYARRIEVPGGYYHVTTRGNNGRRIFEDDSDRRRWIALLHHVARKYGWSVLGYCLMGNHYHLVIQIGDDGISRGMCELNTGYAVTYNRRHGRTNHLFGRRFWSELLRTEKHLLQTIRYVVRNPIRAGLAESPADWVFSSFRAAVGKVRASLFPEVRRAVELVAPTAADPVRAFVEFCGFGEAAPSRWQPP